MSKCLILMLIVVVMTESVAAQYDLPPLNDCPSEILFVSNRTGNDELFLMSGDGTNVRNLTNNDSSDFGARWSPDGSQIVFTSDRDGAINIFVMDADGSNIEQLTFNDTEDSFPVWSRDGSQIAWTSYSQGNGDVFIMNADGSNPRPLITTPGLDFASAWSPDNSLFGFESDADGSFDVFVLPDLNAPDDAIRVTESEGDDFGMAWSPDGKQIAFNYSGVSTNGIAVMLVQTYAVDVDPLRVVSDLANNASIPSWSSDGTQIAFSARTQETDDVFVVNTDGSGLTNLTNSDGVDDYYPFWRPCP